MFYPKDLASLNRDDLVALVVRLQRQVQQLTAVNEELSQEIAEFKRAAKRQAAPFSNGDARDQPQETRSQAREGLFQLPKAAVSRGTLRAPGGRERDDGHLPWMWREASA